MDSQVILITGGNGLIGKALSKVLCEKGHQVRVLSRSKATTNTLELASFHWDIKKEIIDPKALKNVDCIVHLAGENISEKRWTKKQKVIIEQSRVKSAQMLFNACKKNNTWPKSFVASSAIGYYGTFTSQEILTEESQAGNDFLSRIGKKWEKAADLFQEKGIRTVKIRTGVVLSKHGAAFPKMAKPARFGLAAAFGSGKQYVPWIHLDDIVNIFANAIENKKLQGIYNGVAPQHLTNKQLIISIAKGLKKPYFLPNVPSFFFRMLFGEMADILLKGSKVSAEKIMETGFKFKYPTIETAMEKLTK